MENCTVIFRTDQKFIIKVSNTLESKKLLEMQDNVLILLSKKKVMKMDKAIQGFLESNFRKINE